MIGNTFLRILILMIGCRTESKPPLKENEIKFCLAAVEG